MAKKASFGTQTPIKHSQTSNLRRNWQIPWFYLQCRRFPECLYSIILKVFLWHTSSLYWDGLIYLHMYTFKIICFVLYFFTYFILLLSPTKSFKLFYFLIWNINIFLYSKFFCKVLFPSALYKVFVCFVFILLAFPLNVN